MALTSTSHSLPRAYSVKSVLSCLEEKSEVSEGQMKATKWRSVKSAAVDAHERAKDYLDPPEMERLLDAAKDADTAPATHCS